jgi:hypothetical protein
MKKLLIIGIAAIAVLFACGLIALIFGDTSPTEETAESIATSVIESTIAPTAEPTIAPTTEPTIAPTTEPTVTVPPDVALRATIDAALGESNRDLGQKLNLLDIRPEEGSISVGWAADDNFSTDLIVGGMKLDTVDVLKAIDASAVPYEWIFIGSTFAMQDQFGNPDEMEVLTLAYKKETVDRINWENFSFTNVFDIADTFVLHPAFQEE